MFHDIDLKMGQNQAIAKIMNEGRVRLPSWKYESLALWERMDYRFIVGYDILRQQYTIEYVGEV